MQEGRSILNNSQIDLIISRLCYQIVENYADLDNLCIIGIQPRGVYFANRVFARLSEILEGRKIHFGKLDITFFRDDFRKGAPLKANSTDIKFLIEEKAVLLIDDVLYTGRSIHAAIAALQNYGRPNKIDLMVLIDRRFNREYPIKANYVGMIVDSLDEAYVKVNWEENNGTNNVIIYPDKTIKNNV
ncbi:MAG: bifunctional pyr operon transcriptional regulator/uracil phosphoribosyltransferase PyrR [Saprospiraceae bacterium]|nr:bifunctional pyr operon transcriptional regulator/uracil phosphoribosyltransferase PyrR [Saprospiraceae bacterium]